MKIGELAQQAKIKAETIRYYENVGLLASPSRTAGNYREYGEHDVRRLVFIRQARGLGFEMDDVRSLLALSDALPVGEESTLAATGHLAQIKSKISELRKLRTALTVMIERTRTSESVQGTVVEALGSISQLGPEVPN